MKSHLTILLVTVLKVSLSWAQEVITCTTTLSPCKCSTADGKVVDLSPLAPAAGTYGLMASDGGTFEYQLSLCTPQICGMDGEAASCQKYNAEPVKYFILGTQNSVTFKTDSTNGFHMEMSATSQEDQTTRTLFVQLTCDQTATTPVFEYVSASADNTYVNKLTSKYVCPEGPPPPTGPSTPSGGLSGGDVLIIIFFTLLVVYVAAGVVINIFIRKQTGVPNVLPNTSFWLSIPVLIKDGAVFTVSKVRRTGGGSSYQEV